MTERLLLGHRGRLPREFRVTARDLEVVRWIGRLRMTTAAQVGERFMLGRAVSYARLSGLVRLGLLRRVLHPFAWPRLARPSGFEPETFGSVGGRPSGPQSQSSLGIRCTATHSERTRADTQSHEGTRFVPTSFPPLFPPRDPIGTPQARGADGLASSFSTAVRSRGGWSVTIPQTRSRSMSR
jgi:hypothetical protein